MTSRTFPKVEKLWDPHNVSGQIQSIVFSKSKPKLVSNKIKYCKLIAKMFICCVYVSFQWATLTAKEPKQKSGNTVKTHCVMFMNGPLENLRGGGWAKYKKKYSRKGKILARQLILKNIHAMA